MKKKSILLLILVLMLSFVACTCKNEGDNNEDKNKPGETTETINKISDVLKNGKNSSCIIGSLD